MIPKLFSCARLAGAGNQWSSCVDEIYQIPWRTTFSWYRWIVDNYAMLYNTCKLTRTLYNTCKLTRTLPGCRTRVPSSCHHGAEALDCQGQEECLGSFGGSSSKYYTLQNRFVDLRLHLLDPRHEEAAWAFQRIHPQWRSLGWEQSGGSAQLSGKHKQPERVAMDDEEG